MDKTVDLSNMKIDFTAKIKPVKALNESFTLCRCYVLALGKNRNKSNITKDAVESATPTLFNIPVVGNLYEDENGDLHIGGHDLALEKDADGKYKFKVLTIPYGVVPENANLAYEEVEEADGTKNTYLLADIILWTGRNPELLESIYSEDIFWGQSMEIYPTSVSRNKEDKNYTDINEFTFSALCLLGKSDNKDFHVEPCFPSAAVKPKTSDDYDFSQHFEQMKEELAICFSNQNSKKEEKQVEKDIKTHAEEAEETTPEVNPVENEDTKVDVKNDGNDEGIENTEGETSENFALTYKEKIDAINKELARLDVASDELYAYYYLCDLDDKFVYVEENKFDQNGFSQEKGRFVYAFNEGVVEIDTASYEVMYVKWLTQTEVDELEKMREDFAALSTYKAENEALIKRQKLEAVTEEFLDLKDDESFLELVKEVDSFENEDALREKLFALRGKKVSFAAKTEKEKVKIPVGLDKKDKESPYGDFFDKHLNK